MQYTCSINGDILVIARALWGRSNLRVPDVAFFRREEVRVDLKEPMKSLILAVIASLPWRRFVNLSQAQLERL